MSRYWSDKLDEIRKDNDVTTDDITIAIGGVAAAVSGGMSSSEISQSLTQSTKILSAYLNNKNINPSTTPVATTGVTFPSSDYYSYTVGGNDKYFELRGLPESRRNIYSTTFLRGLGLVTDSLGTRSTGENTWSCTVRFFGSKITMRCIGTPEGYSAYADGVLVQWNNGGTTQRVEIDFTDIGVHEVTLNFFLGQGFEGFYITDGFPYVARTGLPRVAIVGDSFTTNTTSPAISPRTTRVGVLANIQRILKCDVVGYGIGGSGYIAGNALSNDYRINDVVNDNPDYVVVMMGINDSEFDESALKVGVRTVLDGWVGLKVFGIGPWAGSLNQYVGLLNKEHWISEVYDEFSNASFLPINDFNNGECWVWGDGDTDTATSVEGSNSQFVTGSDGTHPSPDYGDIYLATKVVESILKHLSA